MIKENKLHFVNQDAMEYLHDDTSLTFILMFEVLDNLPHDLIEYDPT